MIKQTSFFKGLKVIELASVLAGPLAGSFLSELGANVIKVENKNTEGDITRQWKLEGETSGLSAYYQAANYGKTSVMLDFNCDKDLAEVHELIKGADIVISNFQKRVADRYRLDYHSLKKQHSELIMIQLNAYEYDDPRPGFDLVMQAETGFISMCGTSPDHLAKLPVALMDVIAAHQMKEALLLAMIHKMRTGEGICAHVSLYKSAISALVNQATNYLVAGHVAQPIGTVHPNIAPYGDMYYSSDNHKFMLAIGSDSQFEKLGKTLNIGAEEVSYLCKNQSRLRSRTAMNQMLQLKFGLLKMIEIEKLLDASNLPYGKIRPMQEVFTNDLAKDMVLHKSDSASTALVSIRNIAFEFVE